MKTKTILFTVIALFLLLGTTGCDKDNNYNEICTFNTDDPVSDLEWLKTEITKMTTPNDYVQVYLYQNKNNPQKYFFKEEISRVGGGQQGSSAVIGYTYSVIFNCKGDVLLSTKDVEGYSKKELDRFFEENILVKHIWPLE